jgi:hypothetical protein
MANGKPAAQDTQPPNDDVGLFDIETESPRRIVTESADQLRHSKRASSGSTSWEDREGATWIDKL